MENKVNYMQAMNFTNLLHTWREEGNSKNKAHFRKMGLRLFTKFFDG